MAMDHAVRDRLMGRHLANQQGRPRLATTAGISRHDAPIADGRISDVDRAAVQPSGTGYTKLAADCAVTAGTLDRTNGELRNQAESDSFPVLGHRPERSSSQPQSHAPRRRMEAERRTVEA